MSSVTRTTGRTECANDNFYDFLALDSLLILNASVSQNVDVFRTKTTFYVMIFKYQSGTSSLPSPPPVGAHNNINYM